MEPTILYIIIGAAALIVGVVLGKLIFAKNTQKQIADAEQQAQKIIAEGELKAETLKKEKLLEAKEKFVQLKAEHDKDVLQRNQKLIESESRIKQKEQSLNQKDQNLEKQIKENESIKEALNRQIEVVNNKRTELEKHQEEHIRRLEKVAGLSAEDAKA
jgi:ribonucrease Y